MPGCCREEVGHGDQFLAGTFWGLDSPLSKSEVQVCDQNKGLSPGFMVAPTVPVSHPCISVSQNCQAPWESLNE